MHSSAPPRPGELQGKPSPTPSSSPGLLRVVKIQLVGQVEPRLCSWWGPAISTTGGDADVVGEAGGILKDLMLPGETQETSEQLEPDNQERDESETSPHTTMKPLSQAQSLQSGAQDRVRGVSQLALG